MWQQRGKPRSAACVGGRFDGGSCTVPVPTVGTRDVQIATHRYACIGCGSIAVGVNRRTVAQPARSNGFFLLVQIRWLRSRPRPAARRGAVVCASTALAALASPALARLVSARLAAA